MLFGRLERLKRLNSLFFFWFKLDDWFQNNNGDIMTLKKWKVISVIFIFLLSALFHFIYDWIPSFFTSLFFPVNESIWEHNKIIVGSFLILAIIEKIYYKKRKNVIFAEAISSLVCMILVMLIFTPVYLYILKTNDNMIVTFAIFLIAIIVSQIVSYKLLNKEYNSRLEELGIILFVIFFLINIIFTYYPPKVALFYDFTNKIYGLK